MPLARVNSEIQAANLALGHLGQRITALTEDNEAARASSDLFASSRVAVLRMHDWNFARHNDTLSATPNAPAGTFSKIFQLPQDCVVVRSVPPLEEDQWCVEGSRNPNNPTALVNVLSCDLDAARVFYTRDIVDVALWDSLFLDVFALWLASRLAPRIGSSAADPANLEARAKAALPLSRRVNKREAARSSVNREVSYLTVRR